MRTRMSGGVAGVGGRPPPLCRFLGLIFSLYHTQIATLGSKYSFPPTLTIIVV